MKSVVNEIQPKADEPKYPYLGKSASGNVVVLTAPGTWSERSFLPLCGSVTLSND